LTQQQVPRRGRGLLWGGVTVIAAAAWLALTVTHRSGHHHPAAGAVGPALTGWLVMVVAMMLPTTLPLLDLMRRLLAARGAAPAIVGLVAAGYLTVWTVAGAVLVTAQVTAGAWLERQSWVLTHPRALLGGALLLAGAYQFSAVKDRCLTACRSPRGVALLRWQGVRPAWAEATDIALRYAASCVGCCWALMAVGLVTGAGSLIAMALLTVLMAAERLTRHGAVLVRPAGAAAIIVGCSLLLGVDTIFTA
jgi:predicted metal-binding membrane protein